MPTSYDTTSEDGTPRRTPRLRAGVRFSRLLSTELLWEALGGAVAAGLWLAECMLPRDHWRRVERRQRRHQRRMDAYRAAHGLDCPACNEWSQTWGHRGHSPDTHRL